MNPYDLFARNKPKSMDELITSKCLDLGLLVSIV